MTSSIFEIVKDLLVAWREGGKKVRMAIVFSAVLVAIGSIVAFLSKDVLSRSPESEVGKRIGAAIIIFGAVIGFIVVVFQRSKEYVLRERKIEEVERRVQENPRETQAAWELARVKLESYLNRYLSQVRSIFWLTLLVMTAGFSLIGIGVYKAFQDSMLFNASLLTTGSGVLVSFIGGTFLVLYKATMAQAKDYVTILERINAVGMSVQILENINENETRLKDQTTAEVANIYCQCIQAIYRPTKAFSGREKAAPLVLSAMLAE
ncbi:MAG: hypothetical protein GY874_11960 [Desulfobacteraceae bacterium]|nr:hypothetical protein [Desulfobacteraceae bacterium]